MAKKLNLYNHHQKLVGIAIFNKKNATIDMKFEASIHYADDTIDINDYEEYKRRRDLKDENELGQLELF